MTKNMTALGKAALARIYPLVVERIQQMSWTGDELVDFGKHRDKPWRDVPVDYLNWMGTVAHTRRELALLERARRRTRPDKIEVQVLPKAIMAIPGSGLAWDATPEEVLCEEDHSGVE
jgi:predicted ATPase